MTDVCRARTRRLDRVLAATGHRGSDAAPLPSDSNDAWRIGKTVLRICYRGDRGRFERDALVAAWLPAAVRAPKLLEHGVVEDLAWQVHELVDGVPLGLCWSTLDIAERKRAIWQVGESLAELNAHEFPAKVRATLAAPRPVGDVTAAAVVGSDLNPLPVPRARLLLDRAADLTGVDMGLIRAVGERFDQLEPVDPFGAVTLARYGGGIVVHGDAHPMNVLWDDGVVALLDWEWVRMGTAEVEIEPFLYRGLDSDPSLMADSAQIIAWLAEANPDAFSAPDLVKRVWLVELAYTLRHLLLWPPDRPEHDLPTDHPLRRLRRIVADHSHLDRILRPVRDKGHVTRFRASRTGGTGDRG